MRTAVVTNWPGFAGRGLMLAYALYTDYKAYKDSK